MKKLLFVTFLSFSSMLSTSFAKDSTEIKFEIFQEVSALKCETYDISLTKENAYSITTAVTHKAVDLELFKKAFVKSCDYDEAVAIGSDEEFGVKRLEAFEQIVFMQCGDPKLKGMLTSENSSIIAQAAAHEAINLKTFIKAYKVTCDYDIAASLATIEQKVPYSGIASVDVSSNLMNDTKREPAVEKSPPSQSLQSATSTSSK